MIRVHAVVEILNAQFGDLVHMKNSSRRLFFRMSYGETTEMQESVKKVGSSAIDAMSADLFTSQVRMLSEKCYSHCLSLVLYYL